MPTYDYACTECDHRFEHFQSITSDPLTDCPECQGKVRRLIGTGGALIFKGSGFYETDYKKSSASKGSDKTSDAKPAAKDTSGSDGGSGGGGADSGGGESKGSSDTSAA